jgi:agmatine deiminase
MAQPKEAMKPLPGIVPAEWTPHKCMWTAFPSAADLWLENLEPAQAEVAAMVKLLAEGETVKVLVDGDDAMTAAKKLLGTSAELVPAKFGDIWVRDTGPIFIDASTAVRFQNNGWGGKYDLEHDDTIGDAIANGEKADIQRHNFILEGGALEHDGEGTILTTRQCLLNPNRNKGWTEAKAEDALKQSLGARKILWLDDGMVNDHTDGHIDNIVRFIGPGIVMCQQGFGKDDPNAKIFDDIANALAKMTDAQGRKLQVVRAPSPGRYENEDGDVVPASHMNFIIGNKTIAVPTYGTESGAEAVKIIQSHFIHHRVVGLSSSSVLTGGGSFHCITQQVPQ